MSVGSSAGWVFRLGPQHLYPFFQSLHPFISEPRDRNMDEDELVHIILHGMDLYYSSLPLICFGAFSQLSCKFSCPFRALCSMVLQEKLLNPSEGSPELCGSSPSPACPLSSACVPVSCHLHWRLPAATCWVTPPSTSPASLLLCPAQPGDTPHVEASFRPIAGSFQ